MSANTDPAQIATLVKRVRFFYRATPIVMDMADALESLSAQRARATRTVSVSTDGKTALLWPCPSCEAQESDYCGCPAREVAVTSQRAQVPEVTDAMVDAGAIRLSMAGHLAFPKDRKHLIRGILKAAFAEAQKESA